MSRSSAEIFHMLPSVHFAVLFISLAFASATEGIAAEKQTVLPTSIRKSDKADFIFFSSRVFEKSETRAKQVDLIKRFRICLSNGWKNFEGEELEELHAAGCELFIYRWFNGYYASQVDAPSDEDASTRAQAAAYFQQFPEIVSAFKEIHSHPEWILNPGSPMKGSGATTPAFFYDFSNPEFRAFFVNWIKTSLVKIEYDGVFFDYIGGWALPKEVIALWNKKHPNTAYDEAAIAFLRELRAALGKRRIFGNQAHRFVADHPAYYGLIDYDVSESHATSFVWGKEVEVYIEGEGMTKTLETFYRPWDGAAGYKEISRTGRIAAGANTRVTMNDINYLKPWLVPTGKTVEVGDSSVPVYAKRTDRPAIFYGYCAAKLHDGNAYASDWYAPGFGQDDIHFLNLGNPVDNSFHEAEATVTRYFENGFVVLTRRGERVRFTPDQRYLPKGINGVFDVYEGARLQAWPSGKTVEISPAWYPASGTRYPSGRVYMYER
ncbi:MAG: hypothetical protein ACI8QF_001257 [Limisphaerales bacterium]|jgi:hypothetical protein